MLKRALTKNTPLGLVLLLMAAGLASVAIYSSREPAVGPHHWYGCGSIYQPYAAIVAFLVLVAGVRWFASVFDLANGNLLLFIACFCGPVVLEGKCGLLPLVSIVIGLATVASLLRVYGAELADSTLFHIGAAIGVLVIFEQWSLLLLPWLIVSLWVLRPFSVRELALVACGTVMPFIGWICYIVLAGLPIMESAAMLGHIALPTTDLAVGPAQYGLLALLGTGALAALGVAGTGPVKQRSFITVLLLLAPLLVIMFVAMRGRSVLVAPLLVLPVAILAARMVDGVKNGWFADALLVLIALLGLYAYLQ